VVTVMNSSHQNAKRIHNFEGLKLFSKGRENKKNRGRREREKNTKGGGKYQMQTRAEIVGRSDKRP